MQWSSSTMKNNIYIYNFDFVSNLQDIITFFAVYPSNWTISHFNYSLWYLEKKPNTKLHNLFANFAHLNIFLEIKIVTWPPEITVNSQLDLRGGHCGRRSGRSGFPWTGWQLEDVANLVSQTVKAIRGGSEWKLQNIWGEFRGY